jgi:F420-dependent oxidoreductase-like protein
VESTGWDGVCYADHFMPNGEDTSGPWSEAWTTIAALAASVPRIRVFPLVTGNTYRHPAVLAKMAATVDHISGGRLVLGLGAGWQENEHLAYGIPLYDIRERLARLEEACRVIKGLFTDPRTTFHGKYYQLEDAPLEPKPVQDPLPLLIGGGGEKITLRIAARYADEWNVWGDVETLRSKMAVLERHCAEVGRDPSGCRDAAGLPGGWRERADHPRLQSRRARPEGRDPRPLHQRGSAGGSLAPAARSDAGTAPISTAAIRQSPTASGRTVS